jgi:hypothetical protein
VAIRGSADGGAEAADDDDSIAADEGSDAADGAFELSSDAASESEESTAAEADSESDISPFASIQVCQNSGVYCVVLLTWGFVEKAPLCCLQ